jgi:hypothetical protein
MKLLFCIAFFIATAGLIVAQQHSSRSFFGLLRFFSRASGFMAL